MKKGIVILSLAIAFLSCATKNAHSRALSFTSVSVDTIFKQKISIRAIAIEGNKIWYAGDNGRFGFYDTKSNQKSEIKITNHNYPMEFRSIAKTRNAVFVLNIGNPALLYKITNADQPKLVYQETNEKVFYDSMQFWNDREGIAVGDPTENCLSILITRDGGNSWTKVRCAILPEVIDGEAAFAASNTNIVIKASNTWIVSGGKVSRVFYSPDKGLTWQVFNTPVLNGLPTTGIYAADFYNEKIGFVAGGNYEAPEINSRNKAITFDAGKNWQSVADNEGFGYASCVQFIPKSGGKQLITVGATGLYYSSDYGSTWKKLLDCNDLYTVRFVNKNTAIAAGKEVMVRIHFR